MNQYSQIPKINPDHICEAFKLCSVREKNGTYLVAVKYLDGNISEIPLHDIVNHDSYQGLTIHRTYSSGCVFINPDLQKVFLVTTHKDNKIQHQFTGGSPLEEDYSNIIFKQNNHLKVDLYKIEDNAVHRTQNRTGAEPTEFYNERPLVDRVLQEKLDENNTKYRRLVLLLHFVVKTYQGNLGFLQNEGVIDGQRYNIHDLPNLPDIAANAYLVSTKALEIIKSQNIGK